MTHSDGAGLFITSGRASAMVFPYSLYRRQKGEAAREIGTSLKAKRLMSALFRIARSVDLELLLLKGRHRASLEYDSDPRLKQTYL